MSTCKTQKGFFLLRECGRPAANSCSQCSSPMCGSHMTLRDGNWFCLNCASNIANNDDNEQIGEEHAEIENWEGEDSAQRYRKEYYRDRSQQPIDTQNNDHFSEADFSAFDTEDEASFDGDDSAKVDFGDS